MAGEYPHLERCGRFKMLVKAEEMRPIKKMLEVALY